MDDLNLRHLRSFLAVAEELHFGRAADRLGIAQPAVSRHVRSLEDELGAPLFVRTARETRLTSAGVAAVNSARRILSEVDALGHSVAEAAAGRSGDVRVGFVASTVSRWLPALETSIRDQPGDVRIVTSQRRVARVLDELRRGDIDVAVTRWTDGEGLHATWLGVEPIVAVLPPGHALTGRASIRPIEIAGDPLVVSGSRAWQAGTDAMIDYYREHGMPCEVVRQVSGPAEAMALVASGAGIHLRAQSGVDTGLELATVAVEGLESVLFALRREGPADPAEQAVIDELTDLVGEAFGHPNL